MEDDKVMEEEEEEEEHEHFFSDIVPSEPERRNSDNENESDDEPRATSVGPSSSGPDTAPLSTPATTAQIGASPYITPFTPMMSSPSRPKTPSSVSFLQRAGMATSKKPQLVPVKEQSVASKTLPDDVVGHLPDELVDTLMRTVQTLDQLVGGVEDFKADQLGFLAEKVNAYVELLRKVDAAGANYHARIPLHVLEMLDDPDASNPELFTKQQLEQCRDESERAANKFAALAALKAELDAGGEAMDTGDA